MTTRANGYDGNGHQPLLEQLDKLVIEAKELSGLTSQHGPGLPPLLVAEALVSASKITDKLKKHKSAVKDAAKKSEA